MAAVVLLVNDVHAAVALGRVALVLLVPALELAAAAAAVVEEVDGQALDDALVRRVGAPVAEHQHGGGDPHGCRGWGCWLRLTPQYVK